MKKYPLEVQKDILLEWNCNADKNYTSLEDLVSLFQNPLYNIVNIASLTLQLHISYFYSYSIVIGIPDPDHPELCKSS